MVTKLFIPLDATKMIGWYKDWELLLGVRNKINKFCCRKNIKQLLNICTCIVFFPTIRGQSIPLCWRCVVAGQELYEYIKKYVGIFVFVWVMFRRSTDWTDCDETLQGNSVEPRIVYNRQSKCLDIRTRPQWTLKS